MSTQTLVSSCKSKVKAIPNIIGLDMYGLNGLLENFGAKPYVAAQLMQWVQQKQELDFANMSNLSKNLRLDLAANTSAALPKIVKECVSKDGTHKWLLQVDSKNIIETVFIPEQRRGTLCISSQAGCILNCSFCATGKQGFNCNLSSAAIVGQLWLAQQKVAKINHPEVPVPKITNVVMMGMGEPLLNLDAVLPALRIMGSDHGYGLSKRRITVSTAGVVPGIHRLTNLGGVSLALSLHAPNDALRNKIVPLNKKYPIAEVINACKVFSKRHNSRITIEYIMLAGVNDDIKSARSLVKVISNLNCMVNLIPFNPFPGINYKCSDADTITRFRDELRNHGFVVTVRASRGRDIAAACGQLEGSISDRTKRSSRFMASKGKN